MDPQAAIDTIYDAAKDGDWLTICDTCEELLAWYAKGGFTPANTETQLRNILDMIPTEQESCREYVQACIDCRN